MNKKTVLSATTPSGKLTLGNYIGAISNWKKMEEEYNCLYFIADLHALTTPHKNLREQTISFLAQYLALGLDTQKNTLFVQSQVPQHTQLAWILTCLAPMGHLNRMAQFKEKSSGGGKNINAGLFSYPILMAADILLYRADLVPIGEDQKQHLELCRNLVTFFANAHGKGIFKTPTPFIPATGGKIMSLTDPSSKMSKSDSNEKSFVAIIDPPQKIRQKIKGAVTDSGSEVEFDPIKKKGLANLLTIYSVLDNRPIEKIVAQYRGKQYGYFKGELAEVVVESLANAREEYHRLMDSRDYLEEVMEKGKNRATELAQKTLQLVYEQIGLVL